MTARDRAETVAQWFHETYEELAPSFGYKTRPDSAVPWQEVPKPNQQLMIATVRRVLARLAEDVA